MTPDMEDVFVTSELRAIGMSYDEIRKNRRLTHLRRGAWTASSGRTSRTDEYVQMVAGTYRNLPVGGVLSLASAAALHGLPVPYSEMDRVNVLRPPVHRPFTARHARVRVGLIDAKEIVVIQGLPVTALARTVADVAMTWTQPWAVAAADAALARGLTKAAICTALESREHLPGVLQARRVVDFADARSGSPGESISRALIHEAGLPTPRLQSRFAWDDGVDVTDFDWDAGGGVVGEFDGFGKYVRLAPDGVQDPARIVYQEKRREDRLRRKVSTVIRWGWEDLRHPESFVAPLASALGVPYRPLGVLSAS